MPGRDPGFVPAPCSGQVRRRPWRPLGVVGWCGGVGGALVLAGAAVAATGADRLVPRRDLVTAQAQELRRVRALHQRTLPTFVTAPHGAGRLDALRRAGAPPALRPHQTDIDTVHILFARIGFSSNRAPGQTSMPASGDFMLEPDASVIIDPPPHDAPYFEAHLLALRSYYEIMSRGRLVVDGSVFPPEGEPSLKLSDIADYGPGAGGTWTLEAFERYFRDAVAVLDRDSAGRLDLTPYAYDSTGTRLGSIVLVHPGSDLQNDINQDSPNDLPTFFITLADSVPIRGGAQEIRHGLVLPETTIQDNLLGSIQGSLAHEIGHLLGLPDWYDTRFGLPTIGEWSLMDSGSAALFAFVLEGSEDQPIFALGLLPTGLSAMDRVLLGWEEPYVVRAPQDSVRLRPANADTRYGDDPTSARLEVSPEEYFLVENRRDLLGLRPPADHDFCPYLNRDLLTGVVLWMSKDDPLTPSRERHNTGEYDFWISAPSAPEGSGGEACGEYGFGLLVWHVDERPLAEGYPSNSVNNDERYRALRLIEASGEYEIGDWRLPTISFLGDGWNDPFRSGYKTELRAQTVPNNWNSDWALTGWEITDVRSAPPEAHVLYVRTLDGTSGWPRTFWATPDSLLDVEPRGAVVADVSGIGRVLAVADSAALHLFAPTGRLAVHERGLHPESLAGAGPGFARDPSFGTLAALDGDSLRLWQANWDGTSLPLRPGFPCAVPGGAGSRLVLADVNHVVTETADGAWVLFAADDPLAGGVRFDLLDGNGGPEAGIVVGDIVTAADGPEVAFVGSAAPGTGPVVVEVRALPGLEVLHRVELDLPPTSKLYTAGGRVAPEAADAQVVILSAGGAVRVVDGTGGLRREYADLPPDDYLGFALADLDADGFLDLVATSTTRIVGLNSRGARLFGTPRTAGDLLALRAPAHLVTPPIVADVSGDALPEILCANDLGLVYAIDASGALVPGYPRKTLPDLFAAALLAEDIDEVPETRELIAVSSASAAVFSLPGGSSAGSVWGSLGGGAGRTSFASASDVPSPPDGPGQRLLALERPFLAHPNPARGSEVLLRITARSDGPFEIRIYNLEGEIVFQSSGLVRAGAPQEIAWSTAHLASGVYLCRFVSAAAGVTSPLVERITVLR